MSFLRLRRAALVATFLAVGACGSRTGLLGADAEVVDSEPQVDASFETAPDGAFDVAPDVFDADVADTPVVQACDLRPYAQPVELVSFPANNANAPGLVVLDRGTPGADTPARLAVQVFRSDGADSPHPDIQLATARVRGGGEPWIALEHAPDLYGVSSHGWAQMTHAPGDAHALALGWNGDPSSVSRPLFRRFDVDAWNAGPVVEITNAGAPEAVLSLAVGPDGYGVVWRDIAVETSTVTPLVAILDRDGKIVAGPFSDVHAAKYPGRSASIAWTGTTFFIAAPSGDCGAGEPLCKDGAVVVSRVRTSPPAGIERLTLLDAGGNPSSTRIASWGGRTWVAWIVTQPGGAKTIALVQLDAEGHARAPVRVFASDRPPISNLELEVGPLGVIASFVVDGDTHLADDAPGRSLLGVVHLPIDDDGSDPPRLAQWIWTPSTRFGSYGIRAAVVTLDAPRAAMLSWTARSQKSGFDVAWAARLDCWLE